MDWFYVIAERLRNCPDGCIWSDGYEEILCKTEAAADAVADLIQQLYASQGEDVTVVTGYYDPEEDKRNNEEDEYTGWWCVYIQ